jgi:hypothetical protein
MNILEQDTNRYFLRIEKKANKTRNVLQNMFPFLPEKILNSVVKQTTWYVWFSCSTTCFALDNFYEIALNTIIQRKANSITASKLLLSHHGTPNQEKNTPFICGIRSLSFQLAQIVLQSVQMIWSQHDTDITL